ncbi:hypothetical protein PMIN03_008827 [Paraphaeosphaeria minitans]
MMMASRTSGSFRAAAIWLLATVANAGPAVKVLNGSYEGIHLPQLGQDIFLEIPYAQDTGGENRFRVPQAFNEAWNGTRFAQAYSNACHDFQPDADAAYGMGEDCLSISIVRPIGIPENKTLPVAVWIHGDSYQVGTSGRPNYNLTWLVQRPVAIGKHIVATIDGDIIPNYTTELLHSGRFAHIPHMYGSNSDEGTDNAPTKIFSTDENIYDYLLGSAGYDFPSNVVRKIMALYPDDPAHGIPLNTGDERFAAQSHQYKRPAAIIGDVLYRATRLDDARHYAKHSPTYIYRFNTRPFVNGTNATFTNHVG